MTESNAELVARRERAMDRADRALDKAWPRRKGDAYISEMEAAAGELTTVIESMELFGVDPVETSRAYRYLGSVYSDMAPALGERYLATAIDAYGQAEEQLRGLRDPVERAKLDFNMANSMRQYFKNDVSKLEDAERRFLAARSVFAEQMPQQLPAIEEALSSTRSLISVATMAGQMSNDREKVDQLEEQLEAGGDVAAIAEEFTEIMDRDGGAAGRFADLQKMIAELPESSKEGEEFDRLQEQMAELTGAIQGMGTTNDPQEQQILNLLQKRIQEEAGDGKIAGDKAAALGDLVGELGKALGGGDDISTLMDRVAVLRSKASAQFEMLHYLSHGIPRPPEGSRAAELIETLWEIRQFLLEEMNARSKSAGESKAALDLNIRASDVDRKIYEAGADDGLATRVADQSLRPFVVEVREFAARHHQMLVTPAWSVASGRTMTKSVLYSGPDHGRKLIARICGQQDLHLMEPATGDDIAASRFEQLKNAFISVFDLRSESIVDRAAVAYELGIARTLGKAVLVLPANDQQVPFDIDVEPTFLDGSARDENKLYAALDLASVWTMPRPGPSDDSIRATVRETLRRYPRPHSDLYVDQTLKQLTEAETSLDPVAVNATLKTLVSMLREKDLTLIHPAWSPVYPMPGAKRVFHVMPYKPGWADAAAECVSKVCAAEGATYIRGDRVDDPNVIRSIWNEINEASHILVDLTGFSENVALELGIAHTLGKTTVMVGQGDTVKNMFPMIARQRIYPYADVFDGDLASAVETLLR